MGKRFQDCTLYTSTGDVLTGALQAVVGQPYYVQHSTQHYPSCQIRYFEPIQGFQMHIISGLDCFNNSAHSDGTLKLANLLPRLLLFLLKCPSADGVNALIIIRCSRYWCLEKLLDPALFESLSFSLQIYFYFF